MKKTYIISIDPDTDKSGVAIIDKTNRNIKIESLSFPYCIEYITNFISTNQSENDIEIFIEGGWLNKKSNFHSIKNNNSYGKENNTQFINERIAGKVGANHETGKKLCEMFDYYKIPYKIVKPLKKIWKDKKISHDEINNILQRNKFEKFNRTNQDVRDAIIIGLYNGGIL